MINTNNHNGALYAICKEKREDNMNEGYSVRLVLNRCCYKIIDFSDINMYLYTFKRILKKLYFSKKKLYKNE